MGLSYVFKLILLSYYISYSAYTYAVTSNDSVLRCRFCSAVVGDTSDIFNILSPGAINVEQRLMFRKNITVQTLLNPFHFVFEVITTENASCADVGRTVGGRSWFPGYTWRICTCPRCTAQLGWTFEREMTNNVDDLNDNKRFHTLQLRSLLGLTDDDPGVGMLSYLKYSKPNILSLLGLTDDDPGVGMLSYLKYSKPFKTASLGPIRPRATDDTTSNKENTMRPPPISPRASGDTTSTKENTVTPPPISPRASDDTTSTKANTVTPPPIRPRASDGTTSTKENIVAPPTITPSASDDTTSTKENTVAPPPIRPRASDDTSSTKESAMTELLPVITENNKIQSTVVVTKPNYSSKSNIAGPTKTRNFTAIESHTNSGTITTTTNSETSVI